MYKINQKDSLVFCKDVPGCKNFENPSSASHHRLICILFAYSTVIGPLLLSVEVVWQLCSFWSSMKETSEQISSIFYIILT